MLINTPLGLVHFSFFLGGRGWALIRGGRLFEVGRQTVNIFVFDLIISLIQ